MFLQDNNFPLSDVFKDTVWLSQFASSWDIQYFLVLPNWISDSINVFDVKVKINKVNQSILEIM